VYFLFYGQNGEETAETEDTELDSDQQDVKAKAGEKTPCKGTCMQRNLAHSTNALRTIHVCYS
jgi:hypothetical protein